MSSLVSQKKTVGAEDGTRTFHRKQLFRLLLLDKIHLSNVSAPQQGKLLKAGGTNLDLKWQSEGSGDLIDSHVG